MQKDDLRFDDASNFSTVSETAYLWTIQQKWVLYSLESVPTHCYYKQITYLPRNWSFTIDHLLT